MQSIDRGRSSSDKGDRRFHRRENASGAEKSRTAPFVAIIMAHLGPTLRTAFASFQRPRRWFGRATTDAASSNEEPKNVKFQEDIGPSYEHRSSSSGWSIGPNVCGRRNAWSKSDRQ